MLMALVSVSRVSELQALDLRFCQYKLEGVEFRLTTLTKKCQLGAPLKKRFFPSFTEDGRLCIVQCLKQHEVSTCSFREVVPDKAAPLSLSYIKPYKPVTIQRLVHWIKSLMKEAGVNTEIFKAHPVRGVSVSTAMNRGVHLSNILNTADWSHESTFRNFYYRSSVDDNNFAQSVLCNV